MFCCILNRLAFKLGDCHDLISSNQYLFNICTNKTRNMNFPATLKYTKDHEWIKLEGNIATIGITDFAQHELGDIVYVDINTVGKTLAAEEVFGTVEAVKTVSDLFLPIAGTVTTINPLLEKQPELVNTDAYGDGWMIKMEVSNIADVETLMGSEAYSALVG
jgi:glycine cleavage system H protein